MSSAKSQPASLAQVIKTNKTVLPTNANAIGLNKKTQTNANVCVDDIADMLVEAFNSPGSRRFYCKVSWRLKRAEIEKLMRIARADGTTNPGGLFNVLARRAMGEIK